MRRPAITTTSIPIKLLTRCLDWFVPPLCLGCRSTPDEGIDTLNLCVRCRSLLRPVSARRCSTCLTGIEDPAVPRGFVCGSCRRRAPPWDRLLAAWHYEPPLREVVIGLKFARLEYLAGAMAAELASRFAAELAQCEALVPVPLHWWRSLTRGYNQAGLLAKALSRKIDRPVIGRLVRGRPTRAQTGLDRAARRRNLRCAFEWRGARLGSDRHWLLVDDVYTTGATLESAARALRQAGARRITALVVAATPDPTDIGDRSHSRNRPRRLGVRGR